MALDTSCTTRGGQGVIDGFDLSSQWFCVTDWRQVWVASAKRGQDRIIPGLDGVVPFRRRLTAADLSLPFIIVGSITYDGGGTAATLADARAYLHVNIAYAFDQLIPNPATADGQRLMSVDSPGFGLTRTNYVHVMGMDLGDMADGYDAKTGAPEAACLGTLHISMAGGRFA